jgi:O-antigen ligase
MYRDLSVLFSKEVDAVLGSAEAERALGGRMIVWENKLAQWKAAGLIEKSIGSGKPAAGSHNDYIRVLVSNGIIGLIIYSFMLLFIGLRVLILNFASRTPLNVIALMLFLMWLVDSIGLTPGAYPAYQWYVWGFVGLAVRGVEGLENRDHGDNEI